jgi:hypothetical protein
VEDQVTAPAWRKSSYSGSSGDACVEVASWRKSSYSSPSGNACVEVADAARVVLVRDSTDRDAVTVAFPVTAWRTFTSTLR